MMIVRLSLALRLIPLIAFFWSLQSTAHPTPSNLVLESVRNRLNLAGIQEVYGGTYLYGKTPSDEQCYTDIQGLDPKAYASTFIVEVRIQPNTTNSYSCLFGLSASQEMGEKVGIFNSDKTRVFVSLKSYQAVSKDFGKVVMGWVPQELILNFDGVKLKTVTASEGNDSCQCYLQGE